MRFNKNKDFLNPVWCLQSPSHDVYSLQNLMQKSLTISHYSLESKLVRLQENQDMFRCLVTIFFYLVEKSPEHRQSVFPTILLYNVG